MKISDEKDQARTFLSGPLILIVILACLCIGAFIITSRHYTVIYASISLLIVILFPFFISIFVIIKKNRLLLKEVKIRENMEEILKKSEFKYRTIFENARDGIFQTTEDGYLISANPALARIMGYESPQAMIEGSLNVYQLYSDPSEREGFLRIINEKGFVDNYPVSLKNRRGEVLWVSVNVSVVKNEKGDILYYEGSLEDITERKEAEDAVRDSRKLLNDVLKAASEFSIIATDPEGIITVFNRGAELMLGYSSEEITGKHTLSILHDDLEVAARGRELSAMLGYPVGGFRAVTIKPEQEGSETREWTYKRKDGSALPVSLVVSAIRSDNNEITGYLGIATDLTKKKSAEDELKRLASIIRHTKELVALAQLDGQLVFINESGTKMLGIEPGEIEKINIMQLLPDHIKVLAEEEIFPRIQDGGTWEGDIQCLNLKTGALMDVHSINFTINDINAMYKKYWVNISLDLSPQRQAEKMMKENEKRLLNITSNLPGVVYQFCAKDNGEWITTYNSERMKEIFGLPIDPTIEFESFFSRIHKEDRERFVASIKKSVEGCIPWDFEGRFIKSSGEMIWFHGLSSPTRHEDFVMFDGILLDITERKKAEEMSRLLEEKFTTVFMMSPDMVAITRIEDGLVADVNMGFEEITGWKREEVIGRTSCDIKFWVNPADRILMVDELKAGSDVVHREIKFRRKDGSARFGIYSARFIEIAGEAHLIFVMQDITEMRHLEEERRKLEQQLHRS